MFTKMKKLVLRKMIRYYDKKWDKCLYFMLRCESEHLTKEAKWWKSKMDKYSDKSRKLQTLL